MSRLLFIRVSAATYDENDVPKTWPMIFAMVWPDPMLDRFDPASKVARALAGYPKRGVLELVDAFVEHVRFAEMSAPRRKALEPCADKLKGLHRALEEALGNRDVSAAHKLSNEIEEALDEAERAVREAP